MLATTGSAQEQGGRPRVFFDCNGRNCNSQYYRTEISWVSWVNDREVADLHVIMGSLQTGAGGREYQLDFLDAHPEQDEGYEEQLRYQQLGTDTERETLDGLTHTLGLGIAEWANSHGYRGLVTLRGPDPELGGAGTRRLVSQEEVDDPWNLWVFSLNANVNRDSEETQATTQINGGFNASRVSPTWKMNFNTFVNHRRLRRELSTGTLRDIRTNWVFNQLVGYSVAEHWSIGVNGVVGRNVTDNQDFRVRGSPVVEFSFFPYEEATRRSLTARYGIGPVYFDYINPTIYGKREELRFDQQLVVEFDSRQTWGDAGFTLSASHYLYNIDRNNRCAEGRISYRIARGIEVNARGNIAWVNDQIFLEAEEATDEETLLNLQRRQTDVSSNFSVGFRIQFGSIFNNVVNNRFRGIGGFGGGGGFGGRGGPGCGGGF
ncbi:MAG: hypothetical protein PVJ80_03385 [Gemmatimonadota bacterium]|jgi:hypothetical protein